MPTQSTSPSPDQSLAFAPQQHLNGALNIILHLIFFYNVRRPSVPSHGEQRSTGRPPAHQGTTALGPLSGCWGGSPASRMPVPPTPALNLERSPKDPQLHLEMRRPQEPVYTCAKALQSCPTLCNPMGQSPPGSCVHGILQARRLHWAAVPSSRGSSQPRDRTSISCVAGGFFSAEPLGSPPPRPFTRSLP